ncbi:MAG TPA: AAA family ATPase [Verrucomicrobiae bacterium]|jgi:hypothetical protein
MKTQNSESESLWTKAPVANLVRYEPSGIYFARAKVRGKLIRKSLDTNVLSIAKLRLADVLDTEHKAVGATKTKIIGKMIFADALALFQEQQKISTEIKERSKEYNQRCADALLKTWKGLETLDIKRITKQDCLRWRAEFGNRYGATTTNGTLSILRRVFDIAVDTGARYDNPARMKEVKRARVRRKELRLPEPDQFAALIKEVRESGSGFSPHCADGHVIQVVAPQRQQALDLKSSFGETQTVSEFLTKRRIITGTVVIVDEAGQIGGKQMHELLTFVHQHGGRVILSGDTRQHGAVEASDALRAIEKYSGLEAARLTKIRRQNPKLGETKFERKRIKQ